MIELNKITGVFNSGLKSSGPESQIRTGDFVFVKILETTSPSSWKVSIGGRLFTASSDLPLKPGDTLSALVTRQGDRLYLQLPGGSVDPVTAFLNRHGLPVNGITQALMNSFIRNGAPVEPSLINAARKILERADGPVRKNARFLSILSGKGLAFVPPPGVDIVNEFFGSGGDPDRENGEASKDGGFAKNDAGRDGTRNDDRREPGESELSSALKAAVGDRDDGPGTRLHLFNHIREGLKHWVIIPIRYTSGDSFWKGQIRMLIDDAVHRTDLLSVSVSDGTSEWSFALEEDNGRKSLKLFSGNALDRKTAVKMLPELMKLMEKLDVSLDKRITDIDDFDGFSGFDANITFKSVDVSL